MRPHAFSTEGWPMPAQTPQVRRYWYVVALVLAMFALAAPVRALAADPVVAAVGDMVCDPLDPDYNAGNGFANKNKCQQKFVAQQITNAGVNAFIPLGDVQYSCGSLAAFQSAYQPTFGALLNKTYPVPGNHEYRTTAAVDYNPARETDCTAVKDADGYFQYFGQAKSGGQMPANLPADAVNKAKGYYSYDIGSWHIISINTNDNCSANGITCSGPNAATHFKGSAQERWLRNDLAANANRCVMAVMHYPRYSSNLAKSYTTTADPNDSAVSGKVKAIWADLYAGGAEVVLSGHAHNYERFFPQDGNGNRNDAFGVQQFVVGTGGNNLEVNATQIKNSAARITPRFGYLSLTLSPASYSYSFKGVNGASSDTGSRPCHGAPITTSAPAADSTVQGTTAITSRIAAPAATSSVDIFVDGSKVGTAPKVPANCHTNVITDAVVWYTQAFCDFHYSLNTTTLADGAHTIRAVSVDPDGLTTGGPNVNVLVKNDKTAPSVQLTIPTQGSVVTGTITMSANATDNKGVARVDFIVDGSVVGSDTTAPYTATWNTKTVTDGTHLVAAQAFDSGGNASARSQVTVRAQNGVPAGATGISSMRLGSKLVVRIAIPTTGSLKDAAYSKARTRIAYTSPNGIVIANANGTSPRLLAGTKGASQPDWGVLDKRIVFIRSGAIWSIPSTGGTLKRLAVGKIINLATSPNGKRIAFQQIIKKRSDLIVIGITGLGRKNITRTALVNEAQPTWVNNLTLAYARKVPKWAIYRMPAAGGRSVRVTSPTLNCQQPAYSPKGTSIACITRTTTRNYLRTMTAKGTLVRTLGVVRTLPSQPVWANNLVVAFTTN